MTVADILLNALQSAEQTTEYSVFITGEGKPCAVFRLVRKIAKSDYSLYHVCLSVRPSVCMEQLGCQ
jgi:hypothetical protein